MSYIVHNSEFTDWSEDYLAWGGEKFHAVLCDPPYGISFMGKDWDKPDAFRRTKNENDVGRKDVFGRTSRTSPEYSGGLDFQKQAESWGLSLMPLLYPGAIVMMFSGTRMWHRLAAGMEDAGFHLWDTLMWLHGQGFPKAQDISKLIDKGNPQKDWVGFKTPQLKPAWEPVLCFKAPSGGLKYADLAVRYGSGCLNIDAGRIEAKDAQLAEKYASVKNAGPRNNQIYGSDSRPRSEGNTEPNLAGRYPANLILDKESAFLLDEQSGDHPTTRIEKPCLAPEITAHVWGTIQGNQGPRGYDDSGGVSRFFYVAKASRGERELGLDDFVAAKTDETRNVDQPSMNGGEGNPFNPAVKGVKNNHPTVKPIKLNTWLASLLLPPDIVKPRRILVPFSGSGSEMIGCLHAGWDEVVGVEMDAGYCKIAEARLRYWLENKEENNV